MDDVSQLSVNTGQEKLRRHNPWFTTRSSNSLSSKPRTAGPGAPFVMSCTRESFTIHFSRINWGLVLGRTIARRLGKEFWDRKHGGEEGDVRLSPLALETGLCVIFLHPMRPSPSWTLRTEADWSSYSQLFAVRLYVGALCLSQSDNNLL